MPRPRHLFDRALGDQGKLLNVLLFGVAVGSELLGLSISTSFLGVVRYSALITHCLLNTVTGLVWVGYVLKGK